MEDFDLLGPLPAARSTTVLEASAGTGKTFALAGLVTRYIAEDEATLDQMLLITFSRSATQELRDRVRRQIVDAVVAFDDPAAVGDNQVIAHLLDCDADERVAPQATPPRRAGDVRRRDDRHHTPVLPDGPQIPRCRGRLRHRCDAGGEPRRTGHRARRRPLPPPLRPGTRRSAAELRRRAAPGARGRQAPGDRTAAEGRRSRLARRDVCELRERRSVRTGDPQAAAGNPRLRRPAHQAEGRTRRRRLTGATADASAVADRDGRRVPGHRPRAVGGDPPRVHHTLHADPDRRPEAGDLRVPRRGHRHLSQRRTIRGRTEDARDELAQRRRPGAAPAGDPAGRRTRRSADHRASRRSAPHRFTPVAAPRPTHPFGCASCAEKRSAAREPTRS